MQAPPLYERKKLTLSEKRLWKMIIHFLQPLFLMLQAIECEPNSCSDEPADEPADEPVSFPPPSLSSPHFRQLGASFYRQCRHSPGTCIGFQELTAVPLKFRQKCSMMPHWLIYRCTALFANCSKRRQFSMMISRRVLSGVARSITDFGALTHFLNYNFAGALQILQMWAPCSIYSLEPSEPSIFFRLLTGLLNVHENPCKTLRMIMDILPTLQYGQIEMLIALYILETLLKESFCTTHAHVYVDFTGDVPSAEYTQLKYNLDTLQGLYTLVDGISERMIRRYSHLNDVNRVLIRITCSYPSVLQICAKKSIEEE